MPSYCVSVKMSHPNRCRGSFQLDPSRSIPLQTEQNGSRQASQIVDFLPPGRLSRTRRRCESWSARVPLFVAANQAVQFALRGDALRASDVVRIPLVA